MRPPFDLTKLPLVTRRDPWNGEGSAPCRVIDVGDVRVGGDRPVVIAGPCSVEGRDHIIETARAMKAAGADMLRAGAYKPRTSPYDFQGLGEEGLEYLAEAKALTGLPVVTEVMDPRLIEKVAEVADVLQVGSRSMQNFPLLVELGRQPRPVLLKRGFSATLREWLGAAEYVALGGNDAIILCERGIRTFASFEYARNTVDLNVILPTLHATRLPLFLDPSHATGHAEMVPGVGRAALTIGVHGLLVEARTDDRCACDLLCDGDQAVTPAVVADLVRRTREAEAERRSDRALRAV